MEALLATASAEVRRLQALLDEARKTQNAFFEEYQACDSLLSPVRRIPEELLSEVFLWLFPVKPAILKEKHVLRLQDLQLVCRKWRNTAHTCHTLWWGRDIRPPIDRDSRPNVDALRLSLSRAGSTPTWLTLRGDGTLRSLGEPSDESLLRFLATEVRNMTHLALLDIPTLLIQALLRIAGEESDLTQDSWSFKTIESLSMKGDTPRQPLDFPGHDTHELLPNLKTLSISLVILPPFQTPLATLEVLRLSHFACHADQLFGAICSFPALKELTISRIHIDDGFLDPNGRFAKEISAMNITQLVVEGHSSCSVIMPPFKLPHLEELSLERMDIEDHYWYLDVYAITNFLGKHPLKVLSLEKIVQYTDSGEIARFIPFAAGAQEIRVPSFKFIASLKKQKQKAHLVGVTRIVASEAPSLGLMERMLSVFEDRWRLHRGPDVEIGVKDEWPAWVSRPRHEWPRRMQRVGVRMLDV